MSARSRRREQLRQAFLAGADYEYHGFLDRGVDPRTDDGYPANFVLRLLVADDIHRAAVRYAEEQAP